MERTPIRKKTSTKANETTAAPAHVDNRPTCDLVTPQESHDTSPSSLADSASTAAEEPAEDLQAVVCELKLEYQ